MAPPRSAHAPSSWIVREEVLGSHHGQIDMILRAFEGGSVEVGYLRFSTFRGRAHIDMLESTRLGVGSDLVRHLVKRVVNYAHIDWGMTTDDGTKLRAKMDREFGYEPPAPFDFERFVQRHGGQVISWAPVDYEGHVVRVYVEFSHQHALSLFLSSAALLPLVGEEPEEPDVQEAQGRAWVSLLLPGSTPATLHGVPVT